MADDRVDVIFGARIGELTHGVNQVKEQIESLRSPVEGFIRSLGGIAEAVGIAFAIEKLAEFAEKIPEIAERTANLAAAIGTTTEEMSHFQNVIYAATGQQEGLGRVIERLGKTVQTALNDPLSDMRRAFQNVGISMEQLRPIANTPIAVLELLRQHFSELNADANRSTNFYEILGRGMERLIPFLRQPAEKIQELDKEVNKTGADMDANFAEQAEKTAVKMRLLTESITGFGRAVFENFSSPINFAVDQLTRLLQGVTNLTPALKGAITNAPPPRGGPGEGIIEGLFGQPSPSATASIPTLEEQQKLDEIKRRESGGRYDLLHGPGGKTITDFSKFPEWEGFMGPKGRSHAAGAYGFQPDTYADAGKITGLTDFSKASQDQNALALLRQKGLTPWASMGGEESGESGAKSGAPPFGAAGAARKEYEEKIKALDLEQAKVRDNFAEWEAIEQKKLALIRQYGQDTSAEQIKEISAQRRNADEILAVKFGQFSAFEAFNKAQFESEKAFGDKEVALGKETKSKELTDLQSLLAAQHAEEDKALQNIINNYAVDDKQHQKLIDVKIKRDAKYAADKEKIDTEITVATLKENEKQLKIITDGFDTLGHSATGAFNALLLGQETWANSAKKIYQDVGNFFLETVEKMAAKWIASGLANAIGNVATSAAVSGAQSAGGTGLGELLSSLFGQLFGLTIAQTVTTTTETGAITTAIGLSTAAIVDAIVINALTPKPFGFAGGGIVPSAARGWAIPSFAGGGIPAIVHGGEMVLPKNISEGLQGAIAGGSLGGGGGHTFYMNISAWDAKSVMNSGPAIVASINNALRNGSQLRTA